MTARMILGSACALCMAISIATAQPDSLWARTYGTIDSDDCFSIQETSDGGYILGGYGGGPSHCDYLLVRTDADGDSLWSRMYGGTRDDRCHSVQETEDGGYILGGYSKSWNMYIAAQMWLIKTDANGDSVWTKVLGDPENDEECNAVQQASDGGYILAGYICGWTAGSADFRLVRTDSDGDTLMTRMYGGADWDECESVQATPDSGYVLAGWTQSFGAGGSDCWLVKTDAFGLEEWSCTYGGSGDDYCFAMQETADGGYILAGHTESFGQGHYDHPDMWLIKTDFEGTEEWTSTFGGAGGDYCYSVQQTTDGGYVLGGATASFGEGATDFWLVGVDADGDSLWSRTFGGVVRDACRSVQQTSDGGLMLGGRTESYGAGEFDFWMVKVGEGSGAADPFPDPGSTTCTLHQNLPNPFSASTSITFDLTEAGHVTLEVFDLLGRTVATLTNETHPAGTHRTTFGGPGLPAGIHFYRLRTGDHEQTKKMVLLE